jgi:predicted metalloprotease with PDZ domain
MSKQAYLVYGIINRRFLPPKEVVAVLTATTDIEASAFFKAKVAQGHKVAIERISVQRVLTKEGMTPEQLIQAWNEALEY